MAKQCQKETKSVIAVENHPMGRELATCTSTAGLRKIHSNGKVMRFQRPTHPAIKNYFKKIN